MFTSLYYENFGSLCSNVQDIRVTVMAMIWKGDKAMAVVLNFTTKEPNRRIGLMLAVMVFWCTCIVVWLNKHLLTSFHGNRFTGSLSASYDEIKHLNPMDEKVLNYLRSNHLIPPSKEAYDLTGENISEYRMKIRDIFKGKTNGFFIECGANDGEFFSSTLDLEMNQNWSGLLVEANPPFAEKLLRRHRKSWFSDVALAPNNAISEIELVAVPNYNGDQNHWLQGQGKLKIPDGIEGAPGMKVVSKVKCFPLTSLLAAMNVTHVDFFGLDVQGVELRILQTLPLDDSLTIDIILTETALIRVGRRAVLDFMTSKGYRILFESQNDVIFERINRKVG